jgi:hypothetical protein
VAWLDGNKSTYMKFICFHVMSRFVFNMFHDINVLKSWGLCRLLNEFLPRAPQFRYFLSYNIVW